MKILSIKLIHFFVVTSVYYLSFTLTTGEGQRPQEQGQRELQSGSNSGSLLADKWTIPEPTVALNHDENTAAVSLTYEIEDDDDDNIISEVTLWSKECKSGGGTAKDASNGLTLTLAQQLALVVKQFVVSGTAGTSVVTIDLDGVLIVNDEDLYSVSSYDESFSDDDEGGNTTTTATTTVTTGSIDFCVRYALLSSTTVAANKNREVNVVESVVSIKIEGDDYDVDGSLLPFFEQLQDVTVASKKKETKPATSDSMLDETADADATADADVDATADDATADATADTEDGATTTATAAMDITTTKQYNVEAYLCRGGGDNTRVIMGFSQGSMISLCVQPDAAALNDGVVVKSIDSFTWIRNDNGNDDNNNVVLQEAVKNGTASDPLSVYDNCEGTGGSGTTGTTTTSFCYITSLLKADFYASKGKVTGTGSATLGFPTSTEGGAAASEAETKISFEYL